MFIYIQFSKQICHLPISRDARVVNGYDSNLPLISYGFGRVGSNPTRDVKTFLPFCFIFAQKQTLSKPSDS
jgi:hypothetical protein